MGMEILQQRGGEESRPSILLVGPPSVGKTSILNRLITNRRAALNSSAGISCYNWTIDTKYYTANVGIWLARLLDQAQDVDVPKLQALSGHCEALVMVFDLSNDATFDCLQRWISRMDLTGFEILLCVGNKADKLPLHYAHTEYRRKLQKRGESSSDPHPEFLDFGIQRAEGSGLLSDDDEVQLPTDEKKLSRVEWCVDNGIEYIEACALDEVFDDCLSVDGDVQGVARVRGALSAHMWQGLVMKPQGKLSAQARPTDLSGFSSGDDSDFTIEYELLSNDGFGDEPFEFVESAETQVEVLETEETPDVPQSTSEPNKQPDEQQVEVPLPETNAAPVVVPNEEIGNKEEESLEEFEHFMREMAGMRENLRTMPDAQRREMASQIALRMAALFREDGDDSD